MPLLKAEADLKDVIHGSLGVLRDEWGEILGQQGTATLQIHLVALCIQHLIVLPQLPPNICKNSNIPPGMSKGGQGPVFICIVHIKCRLRTHQRSRTPLCAEPLSEHL